MGMLNVAQKGKRTVVTDYFGRPFQDVPVSERRRCVTGYHLRYVIEGMVRGITAKVIKHYYGGFGAATNEHMMLLPRLPRDWLFTKREQEIILGYAAHEVCHQLYTRFTMLDEIFPERSAPGFKPDRRQTHLKAYWNAIEDYRIEKVCRGAHPGFPIYINVTRDHSGNKFLERVAAGNYTPKQLSNPFFIGAVALTWVAARLNRYRTTSPERALEAINPALRDWVESWSDDLAEVYTNDDALALARRMVDDLYDQQAKAQDAEKDEDSSEDTSSQDSQSSGSSSNDTSQADDQPPKDGNCSDGQSDGGQKGKQSNGQDADQKAEQESKDGKAEASSGNAPAGKDQDPKQAPSETDDADAQSEAQSPSDGTDDGQAGANDQSGNDSEETPADSDTQDNEDSKEVSNDKNLEQSDPVDGEDEQTDPTKADDTDQQTKAPSEDADSDVEPSHHDDETSSKMDLDDDVDNSSNDAGSPTSKGKYEGPEDDGGLANPGGSQNGEGSSQQAPRPKVDVDEGDQDVEPEAADLDIDDVRGMLQGVKAEEAEDASILAPSEVGRGIDREQVARDGAQTYSKIKAELSGAASRSSGIVRRMLQAKSRTRISRGMEEGVLDFERVVGMALGQSTVYKAISSRVHVNTAITLMVDNSLSMTGNPLKVCQESAIVLDMAVTGTKTAIEIVGFTSDWLTAQVKLYQYRTFEQKGAQSSSSLGNMTNVTLGGTPVATPLLDVVRRMSSRPEERKIVIVVSDGAASDPKPANNARQIAESNGCIVVGISIGNDQDLLAMKTWCPVAVGIAEVNDLPQALTGIVQEIMR